MNENVPQGGDAREGKTPLRKILQSMVCAACGHHVAVPFYDGGRQPLATLAWPESVDEAQEMERLLLRYVRCVECGHVFNPDFDYGKVPYSEKPNLMFNRGAVWTDYLQKVRDLILLRLPLKANVVEIGCGDGYFLGALAEAHPEGRFFGFDPNASVGSAGGRFEVRNELFDPAVHLAEYRPDLIISRHVLEHLIDPMGFLQALAFAVSWERLETRLFIEVPCIDKVFSIWRTSDFFYEHNSHFTTESFTRLLKRCSREVELVERGYDDEVVYGFVRIGVRPEQASLAQEALAFHEMAAKTKAVVAAQLDGLAQSGKKVAVWGGTGKAAAFINRYGVDFKRFPLVVDSDPDKTGTFVPGAGQEIRYRDHLKDHPVDVILIATQWRAMDIVREIQSNGIVFERILLEHEGRLVDYFKDPHPYRESPE
ncbi:methyltransferase domain-containing protein [Nitrospinota bacterium]